MSRVEARLARIMIISSILAVTVTSSFVQAGYQTNVIKSDPEAVSVPSNLIKKLKSFEPSGVVYLPDLQRYLVCSDDTDKKETPMLFLMNDQGEVEKVPSIIEGVKEMTDIESISIDGNDLIYFMSSMSINKNGKNKISRNLFVQAERQGRKIKALNVIELRPLLITALQNSAIPELQAISPLLENSLDVESHIVIDGHLYIGLKNPQPRFGNAVLLDLGRVQDIFNHNEIKTVHLWKTIPFSRLSNKENTLSEMLLAGDKMMITTTSEVGDGALWSLDLVSNELKLLRTFASLKPEGLAYREKENDLMLVFDQGERAGRYLLLPDLF